MDPLDSEQRSARMARIRAKDTKPEMFVRRLVHRNGYRYRVHVGELPGSPDLVFRSRRKVIFVHGCFWHRHGDHCAKTRSPKSRQEYWGPKFERNRVRDSEVIRRLVEAGWSVLIVWECEVRPASQAELLDKIRDFLDNG